MARAEGGTMVTLATDYGTFTGESEADALKAARKGKREAEKQEAERGANRDRAYSEAAGNGYRLLTRLVKGEALAGRGDWYPACSDKSRGVLDIIGLHETAILPACLSISSPLRFSHSGYVFRGVLLAANGYAIAYVVEDETGGQECYAIGTWGEEWAVVRVHGVTADMLKRDG